MKRSAQAGLSLLMAVVLMGGAAVLMPGLMSAQPTEEEGGAAGPVAGVNVEVVALPFSSSTAGVVLVDKDRQTMCVYEVRRTAAAHERLALVGVRYYGYDMQLEDWSCAEPRPGAIRQMLEQMKGLEPVEAVEEETPVVEPVVPEPDELNEDQEQMIDLLGE